MKYQPIELSKDIITGIDIIDKQHSLLFSTINRISLVLHEREDSQELIRLLNFLEQYTNIHFKSEEGLMITNKYPAKDRGIHFQEHEYFKMKIKALKDITLSAEIDRDAIKEVLKEAHSWLLNHVLKTDRKMALHIRSTEA